MSYRRGHETGHRSQKPRPVPAFAQQAYAERIQILEHEEAAWHLEQEERAEEDAFWHEFLATRVHLTTHAAEALWTWQQDPCEAAILTDGTTYAIGRYPAVLVGHETWVQTSPEALEGRP